MKPFKITEQMMQSAVTYMPIADKRSLAKEIALRCVEGEGVTERNREGEKLLAFPPVLTEDITQKSMLLLNTLLGFYFNVEIPEAEADGTPMDSFARHDHYASGHILNQIDRFKGHESLKRKAYDILCDYKEFKKMVDTEIYALKERNNDPLARFVAAIQVYSTPENVRALLEELKTAGQRYADKAREVGIMRGETENADG